MGLRDCGSCWCGGGCSDCCGAGGKDDDERICDELTPTKSDVAGSRSINCFII